MNTSMEKKADGEAVNPEGAKSWIEAIQQWAKENPETLTNMLAAGGAGAIGGGILTEGDSNDTPGQRLRKKLINALLVGGTAAGAVGLGSYGLSKITDTPDPEEKSIPQHIKDYIGVPAAERKFGDLSTWLYGGTAAAGAGVGVHSRNKLEAARLKNLVEQVASMKDAEGTPIYNIHVSENPKVNLDNLIRSNADGSLAKNLAIASGKAGDEGTNMYKTLLKGLSVHEGPGNKPKVDRGKAWRRVRAGGYGAAAGLAIPAIASGLASLAD